MSVTRTKHKEELAPYYNHVYAEAVKNGGYNTRRYELIYAHVMRRLSEEIRPRVLECGCGTGALAEQIIRAGYHYAGFDFSQTALNMCPQSTKPRFYLLDAYESLIWETGGYDTVVAIEVFEHLNDLRVLAMIPKGTRVIFSVPDFDSYSHLRTYPDLVSIEEYYKDVLSMKKHIRIRTRADKSIIVCNAIKI